MIVLLHSLLKSTSLGQCRDRVIWDPISGILSPWIMPLREGTVAGKAQMHVSPVPNEHNELLSFKSLKSANRH